MSFPENCPPALDHLLLHYNRILPSFLVLITGCQIVHGCECVWVSFPENCPSSLGRLLLQYHRILPSFLVLITGCQFVQGRECAWVLLSMGLCPMPQYSFF